MPTNLDFNKENNFLKPTKSDTLVGLAQFNRDVKGMEKASLGE